jgi:hypothetical protein
MKSNANILGLAMASSTTALLATCSPSNPRVDLDAAGDAPDADMVSCTVEGAERCSGNVLERCTGGFWQPVQDCTTEGLVCIEDLGCVECVPGRHHCEGDLEMVCDDDGMGATLVQDCAALEMVCDPSVGGCISLCDQARVYRSNIGCEYWAVDLDNWYGTDALNPDASGEQFSLVVTNPNDLAVTVTVHLNEAGPGEALDLALVDERSVGPLELAQIDLPQREVDGSVLDRNDGTGTALTSRAFRVTSTAPIVAYQFNPVYQMHTNDASILVPTHALDDRYWVMDWPGVGASVNPLNPASTNYAFLTIVGTEDATDVSVLLSADVGPGGPVPAWTPRGSTVSATLNAFDVFNLEAHCPPEMGPLVCMTDGLTDFTGTSITATAPVAVFAGVECINVVPTSCGGDSCCCDHLEDQMMPASSLGERFVAPHSPFRGGSEPDIWRVLADMDGTLVTTSLPAPHDSFTLDSGGFEEIEARASFTLTSSEPVMLGQYLVSQGCTSRVTGDPAFTTFPPIEQYREDYTFLVPATFDGDNAMIAMAEGTSARLDGLRIPEEFSGCTSHTAGIIEGTTWTVIHCPVEDGAHRLEADEPVGLGVYGYGPAGSYAYPGGTNLERINTPG